MCLRGTGKVYVGENNGRMIYVPTVVGKDSKFPFEKDEEVDINISGNRLVIRRKE